MPASVLHIHYSMFLKIIAGWILRKLKTGSFPVQFTVPSNNWCLLTFRLDIWIVFNYFAVDLSFLRFSDTCGRWLSEAVIELRWNFLR